MNTHGGVREVISHSVLQKEKDGQLILEPRMDRLLYVQSFQRQFKTSMPRVFRDLGDY